MENLEKEAVLRAFQCDSARCFWGPEGPVMNAKSDLDLCIRLHTKST